MGKWVKVYGLRVRVISFKGYELEGLRFIIISDGLEGISFQGNKV